MLLYYCEYYCYRLIVNVSVFLPGAAVIMVTYVWVFMYLCCIGHCVLLWLCAFILLRCAMLSLFALYIKTWTVVDPMFCCRCRAVSTGSLAMVMAVIALVCLTVWMLHIRYTSGRLIYDYSGWWWRYDVGLHVILRQLTSQTAMAPVCFYRQ